MTKDGYHGREEKSNGSIEPEPPRLLKEIKWYILHGKKHRRIIFIGIIFMLATTLTIKYAWRYYIDLLSSSAEHKTRIEVRTSGVKQNGYPDSIEVIVSPLPPIRLSLVNSSYEDMNSQSSKPIKPFYISEKPISVAVLKLYARETMRSVSLQLNEYPNSDPIRFTSIDEALGITEWLKGRLPTYEEWLTAFRETAIIPADRDEFASDPSRSGMFFSIDYHGNVNEPTPSLIPPGLRNFNRRVPYSFRIAISADN